VGVLYGRLAGDVVSSVIALVLIRHSLAPRFSRATLRRMLAYGLPTIPASFGFGLIAGLDRYWMQRTRSLTEVAVYAVALKFFAVVTIAASAFQLAYGPFAFARAQSPEAPRLYARVFGAYMAVGPLGALLVASFVPDVLRVLVPPQYAGAAVPALWLAFAAVALGAYTVTSLGIALALRTPLVGWCAGGALAVTMAAHALLTSRFGGPGAGAATFLGYATAAFLTYRVAQHVHPLPFRGGRGVMLFALALGLALAVQRWAPPGVAGLAVKFGAVAVFVAACLILKVLVDDGAVARDRTPADAAGRSA
jgi:O-antigen/teichoic acid export membrane protein